MDLPEDIKTRIKQAFTSAIEHTEVEKLLVSLWSMKINTGPDQLARAILVLSNGKVSEIRNIFASNFFGDPRNLIMEASASVNEHGNYFTEPFSNKITPTPPNELDGAKVIAFAFSGSTPFGFVENSDGSEKISIYGLAICQYHASEEIYRFSCNQNWEVIQDGVYSSVEEAIKELPLQYQNVFAKWKFR